MYKGDNNMNQLDVERVLEVINSVGNMNITTARINENLTDCGIDSITFIQIIIGLEEAFDCEIPDSKLFITEMDTVQKMVTVLQDLICCE